MLCAKPLPSLYKDGEHNVIGGKEIYGLININTRGIHEVLISFLIFSNLFQSTIRVVRVDQTNKLYLWDSRVFYISFS